MKLSKNKLLSFVLNTFLDLLFLIVLVFSIVCAVLSLTTHFSFFGVRLGVVNSASMEASNIEIGDIVYIKGQNSYQIGDIIAFYRMPGLYDDPDVDVRDFEDAPIWFHEIIDIRVDEYGNYSYLTKGSSNAYNDIFYVPQNFVIGLGAPLNDTLNAVIGFVVSRIGIICLVIVPCIIMLIYLSWELVMLLTEEPDYKRFKYKGRYYNLLENKNSNKLNLNQNVIKVGLIPYNKYNLDMSKYPSKIKINIKVNGKGVIKK